MAENNIPQACLAFLSFLADEPGNWLGWQFVPSVLYDAAVLSLCRVRRWADCAFDDEGFPTEFMILDAGREIAATRYFDLRLPTSLLPSSSPADATFLFLGSESARLISLRALQDRILSPNELRAYRERLDRARSLAAQACTELTIYPGREAEIGVALAAFYDTLESRVLGEIASPPWLAPAPYIYESISAERRALRYLFMWARMDRSTGEPTPTPVQASALMKGTDGLPPAALSAWQQHERAIEADPSLGNDKDIYSWVKENEGSVPSLDTWSRNVRTARKHLGKQKHRPRRGGAQTRSTVGPDQIEARE